MGRGSEVIVNGLEEFKQLVVAATKTGPEGIEDAVFVVPSSNRNRPAAELVCAALREHNVEARLMLEASEDKAVRLEHVNRHMQHCQSLTLVHGSDNREKAHEWPKYYRNRIVPKRHDPIKAGALFDESASFRPDPGEDHDHLNLPGGAGAAGGCFDSFHGTPAQTA